MEKTIAQEKYHINLRNDGILHIHFKENSDIHIEDAKEIFNAMREIGKNKKYPVLIDAGDFVHVDDDVQKFSASYEANLYTIADAIACNSLAQKLIAGFYINTYHPVVPTRIFSDEQEAVNWLQLFLEKPKV